MNPDMSNFITPMAQQRLGKSERRNLRRIAAFSRKS